jgi:hypothetical protein
MGSPRDHRKHKAKKVLEHKIKAKKASGIVKRMIQLCAAPLIVIETANAQKNPHLGA